MHYYCKHTMLEKWTLTTMTLRFEDITLCRPLKVNRRFGGTYGLHFSTGDTALYPRRRCSSYPRCENVKSYTLRFVLMTEGIKDDSRESRLVTGRWSWVPGARYASVHVASATARRPATQNCRLAFHTQGAARRLEPNCLAEHGPTHLSISIQNEARGKLKNTRFPNTLRHFAYITCGTGKVVPLLRHSSTMP